MCVLGPALALRACGLRRLRRWEAGVAPSRPLRPRLSTAAAARGGGCGGASAPPAGTLCPVRGRREGRVSPGLPGHGALPARQSFPRRLQPESRRAANRAVPGLVPSARHGVRLKGPGGMPAVGRWLKAESQSPSGLWHCPTGAVISSPLDVQPWEAVKC